MKRVDFRKATKRPATSSRKAAGGFLSKSKSSTLVTRLEYEIDKLKTLQEIKVKFLSFASHDILNTLSTLKISTLFLDHHFELSKSNGQLMAIIENCVQHISYLAGDLIDWAAMEKGNLRLHQAYFEPNEFLQNIVHAFRIRAALKGIRLEWSQQEKLPLIRADRDRVGQVIMNFLENAVRHTSSGGWIRIQASWVGDELQVAVSDNGRGMNRGTLSRILQNRHPSAKTPMGGRLGLGLSIAQAILKAHGGRMWVRSAGIGKGSSFHLALKTEKIRHESLDPNRGRRLAAGLRIERNIDGGRLSSCYGRIRGRGL